MMRTFTIGCMWISAGLLSALLTVSVFLPAAWLAPLIENWSSGRITLGDVQGSIWDGSAFIGAAASGKDAVTPLLPGRFTWHLAPQILVGRVEMVLENAQVLSQPASIRGNWWSWTISQGSLLLPAERLSAFGAPLNTLQPSGKLILSWQQMRLEQKSDQLDCQGVVTLDMMAMATRLSPLKPLGSYRMTFDWKGKHAELVLQTLNGPLQLNGLGSMEVGHFQFSGTAQAAPGQEEKLAGLLSLLGQPRSVNGKNVIGLEFTS